MSDSAPGLSLTYSKGIGQLVLGSCSRDSATSFRDVSEEWRPPVCVAGYPLPPRDTQPTAAAPPHPHKGDNNNAAALTQSSGPQLTSPVFTVCLCSMAERQQINTRRSVKKCWSPRSHPQSELSKAGQREKPRGMSGESSTTRKDQRPFFRPHV